MYTAHTITITAGTGFGADGKPMAAERRDVALATIRATLATMFGGYTETDSHGGWIDHDGHLITEAGKVWTVVSWDAKADLIDKAKRAAESVRHLLEQTAVVLELRESSAAFIEAVPVEA